MTTKGNKNKQELLGMPFGTANGRLYKIILFDLVKKMGKDKCIRCGESILCVEHMSIDHILPWQSNSVSLFWDISNIGFSHISCNYAEARRGKSAVNRILGGEKEESWCSKHQKFLSRNMFHKDSSRKSGVCSNCKECGKQIRREAKRIKKKFMI